jgi:hypothetical protein
MSVQYAAIAECALLFEVNPAAPACPSDNNNIKTMRMEHWWNDIDGKKPKCSEKNLSQ